MSSEQTCKMITMYIEQVMHNELKECLNKVSFNVVPEAEAHVLNSYQKLAYDSQRRKEIYNKVKNLPEEDRKFGEFVKTPVLMPMTSEERRQIREIGVDSKKGVQKAMYLEHLKYLADTKTETFPQRLKTPRVIGKGKKQKVKYVLEKEYIDLDTKAKYRKEKDGTYVEIQSRSEET